MPSGLHGALQLRLCGKLVEAFPKHAVECGERVDDVGERIQGSAQLDCQDKLTHDLARARGHQSRADEDTALTIAHELERTPVKIVDVASRTLGGIGAGDDNVD